MRCLQAGTFRICLRCSRGHHRGLLQYLSIEMASYPCAHLLFSVPLTRVFDVNLARRVAVVNPDTAFVVACGLGTLPNEATHSCLHTAFCRGYC